MQERLVRNDECLVCGKLGLNFSAVLAPWICDLAEIPVPCKIHFHKCIECDFAWFDRYTSSIVNSIYSVYRSAEYLQSRNHWEPWFTKLENSEFTDFEGESVEKRKLDMNRLLNHVGLSFADFDGVIDFGGDKGQFIPLEASGKKYVIDPSISEVPGKNLALVTENQEIEFLQSLESVPNQSVDLIMACMVIEHLNNPTQFFIESKSKLRKDGILLIEVPLDVFKVSRFQRKRWYGAYLQFISRFRFLFIFIDLITGIYRLTFKTVPIFGILKSSEHINYFSLRSLELLIKSINGSIIASDSKGEYRQGKIRFGNLMILCKFE